jgi:hypothetical protein
VSSATDAVDAEDVEDEAGEADRQRRLPEFVDEGRCQAIAVSTGERCRQDALLGAEYCPDHFPDPDESDAKRRP